MISIEARKIALMQTLLDVTDEAILKEIEHLLAQILPKKDDHWSPTEEEIQGIKEAMKEVEEGKFVSLEEAKERHKKWLK